MFDGGGFGVGLTVAPLDVEPWPVSVLPPGVTARPSRLGEVMPVEARSDAEIAAELQRVGEIEAKLAAYKLELVEGLAARRPAAFDLPAGRPGAASPDWVPGVGNAPADRASEFFADELALIVNCSRAAATRLCDAADVLLHRLPATWAALADGALDWPRARALAAELLDRAAIRIWRRAWCRRSRRRCCPGRWGCRFPVCRRRCAGSCCVTTRPRRTSAGRGR